MDLAEFSKWHKPANNLYLKIAEGSPPASSSWNYGSTFEDESNRFKTSLSPTYSIGIAYSEYSYGDGNFTDINGTDYNWGDIVDLNASPADHSYFMGWLGSGITDPWNENTTLIVNGDQTIYAEFAKTPYLLDIESQIGGSVSPGGSFSYDFDTHVSVIATPEPGYHFKHWQWHVSGSNWFWEQNITQLGSLIYDLNNSSDIEELNATYKDLTGYYSIIENNNLIELVPVQYDDSNNSWAAIADILPASIEKNKAELKDWLDNKGYTPIEKILHYPFN